VSYAGISVSFWLYSADLHRSTAFPSPVEANFRYPYAGQPADPAHAPGYVVLGRDLCATRSVLIDGVEVSREVWYSHYAPVWADPRVSGVNSRGAGAPGYDEAHSGECFECPSTRVVRSSARGSSRTFHGG
jgi:hypothetical protein